MARAGTPGRAHMFLQARLVQEFRSAERVDPLVLEAVRALMPWQPVSIDTLATHLALSASQLRRRCLHVVEWLLRSSSGRCGSVLPRHP
jgi:AraC-like DNA-binding protein